LKRVIAIRRMTTVDIPTGMRLKEQAGWNQTVADWRRYLDLEPDGCFIAELDGEPVGTTTTCVFGVVGWIAMVLVDVRVRGRGIGSALMRHALAYLDECGVLTARLDATPLGQPVYEKLGFVSDYLFVRYEGLVKAANAVPGVEPVQKDQLARICELDRAVTGTDRSKLLHRLFEDAPERFYAVWGGETCHGYLSSRPGASAVQIGPCGAEETAARLLLADACHRHNGERVYIDVPADNPSVVTLVESLGMKAQRNLMRMHRGQRPCEQLALLWASSGPAMG
jgi:GNAT superfamily N-acetyltransferase